MQLDYFAALRVLGLLISWHFRQATGGVGRARARRRGATPGGGFPSPWMLRSRLFLRREHDPGPHCARANARGEWLSILHAVLSTKCSALNAVYIWILKEVQQTGLQGLEEKWVENGKSDWEWRWHRETNNKNSSTTVNGISRILY